MSKSELTRADIQLLQLEKESFYAPLDFYNPEDCERFLSKVKEMKNNYLIDANGNHVINDELRMTFSRPEELPQALSLDGKIVNVPEDGAYKSVNSEWVKLRGYPNDTTD